MQRLWLSTRQLFSLVFIATLFTSSHISYAVGRSGAISASARELSAGVGVAADPRQRIQQQHASTTHNSIERVHVLKTELKKDDSIQISAATSTLDYSGQWLSVTWTGVAEPQYDDWIGLYVPADAPVNATAPAKFKWAVSAASHMTDGRGSLRFRVINYRQDFRFVFMRGGLQQPVAAAYTQVVRVSNPNEPLQAHLALTGNASEMQLQWATKNSSAPTVRWGSTPGQYNRQTAARSFTYAREDMCGAPAATTGWLDPGTQHVAVMTGLKPGRRYYYVFGDEAWGWSTERSFTAAPPTGPATRLRLLAVADMGQGEEDGSNEIQQVMAPSLNTSRLMAAESHHYSLVLHNGDLSYANGYAPQWDNFMAQIEPLASRAPYMVCPGNHERDWPRTGDLLNVSIDSGGECGVHYERRFTMPISGKDQLWYSFDYGPIHFLTYSTEHPVAPGTPQHDFITKDLEGVDRRLTPWVVVNGHRPLYVSSNNAEPLTGDLAVGEVLRAALEELFMQYKVDLTLHGHHHTYQRTCPMYKGECRGYEEEGDGGRDNKSGSSSDDGSSSSRSRSSGSTSGSGTITNSGSSSGGTGARQPRGAARAPVHLVIGHGGAGLSFNLAHPSPEWLEAYRLWWGYLRMDVSGTDMSVEIVSDEDGSVMDSFKLIKPPGWGEAFMATQQQQQQHLRQ